MTKKSFLCAIFALVVMFISGCSQDEQVPVVEDTSSMTKEQVMKEVIPVLQGFLNAQYDYVIGKDEVPQWDEYLLTGGDSLKEQLDEHKRLKYWYDKTSYLDYTSKVITNELSVVSLSGSVWNLQYVLDKFSLTSKSEYSQHPIVSEGGYPYDFSLQKVDGKWKILSWQEKDEFIPEGRWNADKDLWSQEPYNPDKKTQLRAATFPTPPTHLDLRRLNARNYAHAHWNNPSSSYHNFHAEGGDCTNFVSQCLLAGGGNWTQVNNGSRCTTGSWFYNSYVNNNYSCSWTLASGLQNYLVANSSRVDQSCEAYEIGDIIQNLSGGSATHSMLITKIENGTPYVTFRSVTGGERKDQAVSSLTGRKCWKIKYN